MDPQNASQAEAIQLIRGLHRMDTVNRRRRQHEHPSRAACSDYLIEKPLVSIAGCVSERMRLIDHHKIETGPIDAREVYIADPTRFSA